MVGLGGRLELDSASGSPERERLARIPKVAGAACGAVTVALNVVDGLGHRLLEVALLEGDFTLRSGKRSRWYLDKYRFETDPGLLRELGERLARGRRDVEPEAVEARGTGSRGGRAGRFGGHGVRAAVHHRAR